MESIKDVLPANPKDLKALEGSSQTTQRIKSERFAFLWAKLCGAYPRQAVTASTAEIFYEQLSVYTEEQVSDAINGVIATSKWFPAVAEVIEQIEGERQCPHNFIAAELRLRAARLSSREQMVADSEKYADQRFKQLSEKCAQLESKSLELYKQDRKWLEESGLAQAQAKLDGIKNDIQQAERMLTTLRAKIKLFDQARILQGDGDGEAK